MYINSSASSKIVLQLDWHRQLEVLINHIKAGFKVWPMVTGLISEAKKQHCYPGVQQSLPYIQARVCTEVPGLIWLSGTFLPQQMSPKGHGVCGSLPTFLVNYWWRHVRNPCCFHKADFGSALSFRGCEITSCIFWRLKIKYFSAKLLICPHIYF